MEGIKLLLFLFGMLCTINVVSVNLFIMLSITMLTSQIPGCSGFRGVLYRLEFPDSACPPTNTPPAQLGLLVETGTTAFDVMIAGADKNRSYNFKSTYLRDSGFVIDAVNGTPRTSECSWVFYYQFPLRQPIKSQLGVSNVVIPGHGFKVILRYQR